ncbi:Spermidine/putrescine ABC transporter [Devosia sp. LC5]|uniref:ABC transporter permease n=1 Tax=Devosia sp. LC5 TaxID=1502724 RepID=UPI0004E2FF64|nr:ABC transporter permease [Devosia sp. LC5]KFC69519.1 Spermidine/putrescine ABC transporter [Devosia sp. LC5]
MGSEKRTPGFYMLAALFILFVLFLYGPLSAVFILSFQGPQGGLTFPLNGVSLRWFQNLFETQAVGNFGASFGRSLALGLMVMIATVLVSLLAGLAFRRKFLGASPLFYLTVASLVVPSIIVSLGIGVLFQQIGIQPNWFSSGFGAHLTWTLPFGVLIMFAVFNRFSSAYEEAARDLGASSWQTFYHVVLPMIAPSLIGVGLFGFSLSYDEFARTLMTSGSSNTLPLEIYGMTTNVTTPVLYALGTVTTLFSFLVILVTLGTILWVNRRRAQS